MRTNNVRKDAELKPQYTWLLVEVWKDVTKRRWSFCVRSFPDLGFRWKNC